METAMPTPLQLLLDPLTLSVVAIYAALATWEALAPARPLPHVPGWRAKGALAFLAYLLVAAYLPFLWADLLPAVRLVDLSHLGTAAGAAVGVLVYEAGAYFWHRSMHGSTVLWRGFHQWHHSAERLDVAGAYWFSPLDIVGWTALSSLCLTGLVGLAPQAVFVASAVVALLTTFQHANVRTPRWLGYFMQRPESHSRHHARGVHAGNYADLPLFDLLFGTFHNPAGFAEEAGLGYGASGRILDMLRFRDVSTG
jgi:sterol desaturase/sphingolipid hydroxylase (fatty acid hydroxylase superfamily)